MLKKWLGYQDYLLQVYLKASDNYPQADNEMKEWHLEANFIGGQQLQKKFACLCKSWVNF